MASGRDFIHVVTFLGLYMFVSGWELPEKLDYRDHHCNRDCLTDPTPRTCAYNFTLEDYRTLSFACFQCPQNQTDCFRPHCVPGDGRARAIKVVNRQMPGPAINVCKGDTVQVRVYNQFEEGEGVTIHWHGILQHGTQYMDGAPMVTQCPIPAYNMFQYEFSVTRAGTHFWHAHTGFHRGDGVFGALVVRETQASTGTRLYDHDLPEHTLLIHDWLDESTGTDFMIHHHGMSHMMPASILINGRGSSYEAESRKSEMMNSMGISETRKVMDTVDEQTKQSSLTTDQITVDAHISHNVFRVARGQRYRFRIISNGLTNCPLKVSVEGHRLTVVASDGLDHDPSVVDSFTIYAGERYDVVINADQPVGNYWLYVAGLGFGSMRGLYETAILRYDGAPDAKPDSQPSYEAGTVLGKDLNPPIATSDSLTPADLTSSSAPDDVTTREGVVKRLYIGLDFNPVGNPKFFDSSLYPMKQVMGGMMGKMSGGMGKMGGGVGKMDGGMMGKMGSGMGRTRRAVWYGDIFGEKGRRGNWMGRRGSGMMRRGGGMGRRGGRKGRMGRGMGRRGFGMGRRARGMEMGRRGGMGRSGGTWRNRREWRKRGMGMMGHNGMMGSMHAEHMFTPQINYITYTSPPAPLLTQYKDMSESDFCNVTSVNRDCHEEFCECVHRIKVDTNDVVEWVMVSESVHGDGAHPMHLHGASFYILGMEKLGVSITKEEVAQLDSQGRLHRNLRNPIQKDTVVVPDGGYTIIRFKATNPGFWFFHCHNEMHMAKGMMAIFQVGEVSEMAQPPANFPKCGNWAAASKATMSKDASYLIDSLSNSRKRQ